MMTRWHEEDLIGKITAAAEKEEGLGNDVQVERYTMPAIAEAGDVLGRKEGEPLWPERWPLSSLEARRSSLETYWWSAFYQQRPTQFGETAWPEEYFAEPFWCKPLAWPTAFNCSVICCDPSKGKKHGDPSALVFLGEADGLLYVAADIKLRPVPRIVEDGIAMWQARGCDRFGLESNHFQELMGPEFGRTCAERGLVMPPISLINNDADKVRLRIPRLGPYLHRHKFRFANDEGTRRLVRQLRDFPFGAHDDGPDALEMCLRLLGHASRLRGATTREESVYA
jgi:predicted phage terminase large subunit-like protein